MVPAKDNVSTDATTVIGPSILINGKLTGDEDLTVRGRVEGELSLSRTLMVETSGIIKANVSVRNAIVSGVVVGNITATESVELTKDGRMVGDIRSPRVIIVDGASFRGQIDMGNAEPRPAMERPAVRRPTPVTTMAPRPPAAAARPPERAPAPPPRPAAALSKPLPPPPPKAEPREPAVASVGAKKKILLKKK